MAGPDRAGRMPVSVDVHDRDALCPRDVEHLSRHDPGGRLVRVRRHRLRLPLRAADMDSRGRAAD